MYKKTDFRIGEILFSIKRIRFRDTEIKEHKIAKIGKQYLKVYDSDFKIRISDLHFEEFDGTWELYKTKKECEDIIEKELLIDKMYYWFVSTTKNQSLSLEQLKRIDQIIGEKKEATE